MDAKASSIREWASRASGDEAILDHGAGGTIARLYKICHEFWKVSCNPRSPKIKPGIPESHMRNELARFHLWAVDINMDTIDKALDFSPYLQSTVLRRLFDIGTLLSSSVIVDAPAHGIHEVRLELMVMLDSLKDGFAEIKDDCSNDSDSDTSDGEVCLEKGVFHIPESIAFHIKSLLEATPSILQCFEHLKTGVPLVPPIEGFITSGPAQAYIMLVRDKFPKASTQLVERLGEANWQRHAELRDFKDVEETCDPTPEVEIEVSKPIYTFRDSGYESNRSGESRYPASIMSIKSHSSFKSDETRSSATKLRVPSVPDGVVEGSEPCPYCSENQTNIDSRVKWKRHVFFDLRPYICTHDDCAEYLTRFAFREEWAKHEFSQHRYQTRWICPECETSLRDPAAWRQHFMEEHTHDEAAIEGSSVETRLCEALQVTPGLVETEQCHLCHNFSTPNKRNFIAHVGQHMEEVALLAIPRLEMDDEGNSSADSEASMKVKLTGTDKVRDPTPSDGKESPILPPLIPVLPCPFDILGCRLEFQLEHEAAWIEHSLDHFVTNGPDEYRFEPPKENSCCFCEWTFGYKDGNVSWRERMLHVAGHHRIGHTLKHASPNFNLLRHFWRKRVIDNETLTKLTGRTPDRSWIVGDPSPPVIEPRFSSEERRPETSNVHSTVLDPPQESQIKGQGQLPKVENREPRRSRRQVTDEERRQTAEKRMASFRSCTYCRKAKTKVSIQSVRIAFVLTYAEDPGPITKSEVEKYGSGQAKINKTLPQEYLEAEEKGDTLTFSKALELAPDQNIAPNAAPKLLHQEKDRVWSRIRHNPTTYILTREEFAVLNYFKDDFENELLFRSAVARFWSNYQGDPRTGG
ncbi:uncharacterized protein KY384_004602 [Bacidia gigantensis]|uniref:uncharacterized protein n=1 Tax=Bacidia gigantensis TaxID=2732470 RepID=UPI001D03FDDB|nr:uncharacterized protein KY384_004602 [Bacidia gigantensis]KAG8531244.1 hypothetical protein KY384_004602 [Bacidia gigantensis]